MSAGTDGASSKAKLAAGLRRAGWEAIPLIPGTNRPAASAKGHLGYSGAPADDLEFEQWTRREWAQGANIGIRLPDHLIVIDVDNMKGKNGGDSLAALERKLGPLPPTYKVTRYTFENPHGHLYFRVPRGLRWTGTLYRWKGEHKSSANIDIRSRGISYVVAPGSVRGDTVYQAYDQRTRQAVVDVRPDSSLIAELPEAWVRYLSRGTLAENPPASPDELISLEDWFSHLNPGKPTPEVQKTVDDFRAQLAAGCGAHEEMVRVVARLIGMGNQGIPGILSALEDVRAAFVDTVSSRTYDARSENIAQAEVDRALTNGVAKFADLEHLILLAENGYSLTPIRILTIAADVEESFWMSRTYLQALRDFARARRVSPWTLFGCVMARVCAALHPRLVLPPLRGGLGSLNLFFAIAGEPGGGKSAAMAAADEFLHIEGGTEFLTSAPGSGEGLIAQYVCVQRGGKDENGRNLPDRMVQHRESVLFAVDEVDALAALLGRSGSTLGAFLKSAWTGGLLATANAGRETQRYLEPHAYRFAMVIGVQPLKAQPIFDDAAGGLPQRIVWLPSYDPEMLPYEAPEPDACSWRWRVPTPAAGEVESHAEGQAVFIDVGPHQIPVPVAVKKAVFEAAALQNRPIGSAPPDGLAGLDGHAVFTREKLAVLLAALDGRLEVSDEDWELAGVVTAVSDRTRAEVLSAMELERKRQNEVRARSRGRSVGIAEDATADYQTVRVMDAIRKNLQRLDGECLKSELRKLINSRSRKFFDEALQRMTDSRELIVELRTGSNEKEVEYARLQVPR